MPVSLLIALGGGVIVFLLLTGVASLTRAGQAAARERVQHRLRRFALTGSEAGAIDLVLKQSAMSSMPWFNRMLSGMRLAAGLKRTISQANARGTAGVYLLACGLLGLLGAYAGLAMADRLWVGMVLAWLLGSMPVWHLRRLKARRMGRFQAQLPEALDLMSRALKAGHTFGGGMRMVANEFADPIGGEFGKTLDEINYGMDVDRALANLQLRVDVEDLKFFVVSVNIQRETGGNLAEIIANIARLVRERFALFGKVRVLSAEGRISALLLSALPFFIAGVLYFINPDYISLLWTNELGRSMAWGAVASMIVGIVVMRRMVKIQV
ncbi:MAG: type II secretion system F family protein [Pseudodesulfovibrio sp.]|uniref:Type II secretion system F domain protein n=1 Tax=Pseudodesulfovibrio aespoeensis (strain ATCC 700646 / DSM 10631 / Aspo-2) TaxID=643562 RepID=E6VYN6_PSEA9|nr:MULTISPECIES: type II secretion system F family protein [Pseudodesulfovibrio]MBU4192650.1 type II secretion system F family protein [Pseudomonadota bacterium]ADU63903.1 Type II secretion system F domain protein [Pseudodesulfovibrio aespoeensis Aspo-2]MBU4243582.1 type II secretion system F family protein [Pseudomonadota bacterium]MBU4378237.1 type II secretion system F family protein [Pseudomonadota bacterium]MBU4475430.1 type II secretion system F family protein [Pseudomonadota bacterium]